MKNRRQWPRVTAQLPALYAHCEGETAGVTLNVSEQGARLVVRHPIAARFRLTLQLEQPVVVEAETVWEQPLHGGGRILGVRFQPKDAQRAALAAWMGQRRAV